MRLILAACLALAALPAAADDRLHAALSLLPASVAEGGSAFVAGYVLPPAAGGADPRRIAMVPMGRGVEGLIRDPAGWSAGTGLPAEGVAWILAWGPPDRLVTVYALSPGARDALPPALAAAGFAEVAGGFLQNGDPMALDLAARSPAGLWRDALGRGAVVAVDPAAVRLAPDPALLAPAEASPLVAMVLAGLDSVAEGEAVRQAAVLGMEAGVQPVLPDLSAAPSEMQPAAARDGLPVWGLALLADLGGDVVQVTVHADCAAAEAALAFAAKAWGEIGPGTAGARAVPLEGACAAALRLDGADFSRALNQLATRDFPPLRMAGP